ncbi:MAG: 30S ribosomal protein S6 [Nitrospirales bacterium]|nr:30S ribosomal protein S6 [Nitrospirales bacterium]
MNIYENVVILNPSLSEDEVKAAVEKISSLITNNGGEVLKVDHWGKRRLAYELNKQKFGIYILFLFKAPSNVVGEIESYFKVYDPIIKFMVIKLTKKQLATLPPEKAEVAAEA